MNKAETFSKTVEIQTPKASLSFASLQHSLYEDFDKMPLEKLRQIPLPLDGKDKPKNKSQCVMALSNFFASLSLNTFESWLCCFPPLSQEILRDAALFGYAVLDAYKAKSDKPLLEKDRLYYSWDIKLEAGLKLGFLWTVINIDKAVAGLTTALREVIRPWFAGPPEASLSGCAIDEAIGLAGGKADGLVYNNALEVAGSFPLLCEALPAALTAALSEERDPDDTVIKLKPFPKRQLAALRSQCGFKPFPPVYDKAPDALDLAARFTLCTTAMKPQRPGDGQDGIKGLVQTFFGIGETPKGGKEASLYQLDYLEIYVLTAHFKKKSIGWGHYRKPPPSRGIFRRILTWIAQDGRWFSTERLARYIQINETEFNFIPPRMEDRLFIQAASLVVEGIEYHCDWSGKDIWPFTSFRRDLLVRPLFNAYCYLFAALGLLEITQKTPPEPVTAGPNKTKPFSLYDALDAVRITELGRWCLDLTETRPGRIQEQYEAIADKELLLVTVQGSSFERSLYLDAIGSKLGDDRWRISPRSFVSGCADIQDIEERISKFKRLIDPHPASHWEALFSQARDRADFLNRNIVPAAVYYLGDQRSLTEELLNDPALASCAMRAEGRLLVVPDKHKKKFYDLLANHGVMYS